MKLNFWQWLGLALLVVGLILLVTRQANRDEVVDRPGSASPATTQQSGQ